MRRVAGLPRAVAAVIAGCLIAGCTASAASQPGTASQAGAVSGAGAATATATATGRVGGSIPPTGTPPSETSPAGTPHPGTSALPARWGNAADVPGLDKLNAGLQAQVLAVSCPSPGDCGAGGYYSAVTGAVPSFVVTEAG